jgi:SCF-associated factor 1
LQLPYFSELEKVKEHFVFDPTKSGETIVPPKAMRITHISAQFRTFIAYSPSAITIDSVVLMGGSDITTAAMPEIIPSLQYRDVISVVLGDYHYGALTSKGELYVKAFCFPIAAFDAQIGLECHRFTWGQYSHGALGLGDPVDIPAGQPGGYETEETRNRVRDGLRRSVPPRVEVPAKVTFAKKKSLATPQEEGKDHEITYVPKQSFCYLAAAAGWHMGALIIDLEVRIYFSNHSLLSESFIFSHSFSRAIFSQTKRTSA